MRSIKFLLIRQASAVPYTRRDRIREKVEVNDLRKVEIGKERGTRLSGENAGRSFERGRGEQRKFALTAKEKEGITTNWIKLFVFEISAQALEITEVKYVLKYISSPTKLNNESLSSSALLSAL